MVGAEGGLGEDGALHDGVAGQHVRQLPLDLLCHHLHPSLLGHAPHHVQPPYGDGRLGGEGPWQRRGHQRPSREHPRWLHGGGGFCAAVRPSAVAVGSLEGEGREEEGVGNGGQLLMPRLNSGAMCR